MLFVKIISNKVFVIRSAMVIYDVTERPNHREIGRKASDFITGFSAGLEGAIARLGSRVRERNQIKRIASILNDFLLKLHETAYKFKDLSAHSRALAGNTDAIIRNFLVYALQEPKSSEDLSKLMGIPKDNIKAILDKFSKVGVAEKKGDLWHLKKSD